MLHTIRTAAAVCLALMALPAVAQDRPSGLQPLPDATTADAGDDTAAPARVIRYDETRINGIAFQPMVTPTAGRPYYLIDNRGDANRTWTRRGSLDSDLRVPQWSAGSF